MYTFQTILILSLWIILSKCKGIIHKNETVILSQYMKHVFKTSQSLICKSLITNISTGCLIMIWKEYELIWQTKKHHWKSRQVAKFQWVWSILIFNDFVWNNYIFIFHTNMPEKWSKIEKFEKFIEKIHKFYLPYGFCSHLHNSCRFCLKLKILVAKRLNFIWYFMT